MRRIFLKKNILIEGIDCAGKSTLAKEIRSEFGSDIKFLGHQKGWQFDRYLKEYALAQNIILERGHLSEEVYSHIFGREPPFTSNQRSILEEILKEKFIVVMCIPKTSLAKKRYRERKNITQNTPLLSISKGNYLFKKTTKRISSYKNIIIYKSQNFSEIKDVIKKIKQLQK